MTDDIWYETGHEISYGKDNSLSSTNTRHYKIVKVKDGNNTIYILKKDNNPIGISAVSDQK